MAPSSVPAAFAKHNGPPQPWPRGFGQPSPSCHLVATRGSLDYPAIVRKKRKKSSSAFQGWINSVTANSPSVR